MFQIDWHSPWPHPPIEGGLEQSCAFLAHLLSAVTPLAELAQNTTKGADAA